MRRWVVALLFLLALLAVPLAAGAQPLPKPARLGILAPTSTQRPQYAALAGGEVHDADGSYARPGS